MIGAGLIPSYNVSPSNPLLKIWLSFATQGLRSRFTETEPTPQPPPNPVPEDKEPADTPEQEIKDAENPITDRVSIPHFSRHLFRRDGRGECGACGACGKMERRAVGIK